MEHTDAIVVVGGGIGGLVTALSLHQDGHDVVVHEAVPELRALGVGINLLPHAVRELDALGLLADLEAESVAPTALAYFTKRGQPIWEEQRGRAAGYRWPQLSVHRGTLHRILSAACVEQLGHDRIRLGHRLTGVRSDGERAIATFETDEGAAQVSSPLVIGADGIHSAARAQRYPHEGMPEWNGALLWRGLAETEPVLDGRTMVWAGHPDQKFVGYPVLDLDGGRQLFNFIAEFRTDSVVLAEREDWNQPGRLDDFIDRFESWRFDWLDVPALIRSAPGTFRFPMVDRDPVDRWTFGRTTLLGDAAHPMYPIGSNGASQAILDARVLTGCLRSYPGDIDRALERYEEIRRPATAQIVLANRGLGPEAPMQLVEERAPDGFDDIGDVIIRDEILAVTDGYRRTAGFALEALADGTSIADRVDH
ncbi:MAG: flavin-dependent oxidoreductase [Ilumatobacter fluminis]|uniref:flavin-dependent oxidoreductase n=1 Tax=Ilumatobacter fluminis TaxID=467091 RepID=UPI0032EA9CAE